MAFIWVLPCNGQSKDWHGTFLDEISGEILTIQFKGSVATDVKYSNGKGDFISVKILESFMMHCGWTDDINDSLPAVRIRFNSSPQVYLLQFHHYEWYGIICKAEGKGEKYNQTFVWCGPLILTTGKTELALGYKLGGAYRGRDESYSLSIEEGGIAWYYQADISKKDSIRCSIVSYSDLDRQWVLQIPGSPGLHKIKYEIGEFGPEQLSITKPDGTVAKFQHTRGYLGPLYPIGWLDENKN
ncbi:MAG: hypothetical protein SFY70_06180 [Bacteroidia bacterium]|nr:hypothetical protein [Bacteroidia bacterium]